MKRKLVLILLLPLLFTSLSAQAPRKKHKDFGSSLENLQYDPITREVIAVQPRKTKTSDQDMDVIRVETSLVAWDVLVVDAKGDNVQGLTADDFVVTEDGQAQTVGHFLLGDNKIVGRTIVLIMDYSGSQLPYIRNSVDAAKLMVDKLSPLDQMAIVTDDVELIVDYTSDKNLLKKKLESLYEKTRIRGNFIFGKSRTLGKSAQYSSLFATLNEMFDASDRRQIIVFQTDGDEVYRMRNSIVPPQIPPDLPDDTRIKLEQSFERRRTEAEQFQTAFTLADIYRASEKSRATIYTVIPGERLIGASQEDQIKIMKTHIEQTRENFYSDMSKKKKEEQFALDDLRWRTFSPLNLQFRASQAYKVQLALAALSIRTGGWADFLEKPEQASAIYARIFDDINRRYIVGYYPTNKSHDGKRRTISVTIKNHPEYTVVGRRAYYAPKE